MSLIVPVIHAPCKVNPLPGVNKKLQSWAQDLENNIRFGFDKKIDYVSFESLVLLRDIFIYKLNCADWLCDVSTDDLADLISNYTKKYC